MQHQVSRVGGGSRCRMCGWRWPRAIPTEPCPGVRRYRWNEEHPGLLTHEELRQLGLRPGAAAVGAIWLGHEVGWLRLYDLNQAQSGPRRPQRCARCGREVRPVRDAFALVACRVCRQAEDRDAAQQRDLREFDRWRADRAETIRWAQRLLARDDLVIFDSETTALDGEFVQVAVIDRQGTPLMDTLVRPQGAISADAYALHHISQRMVAAAPSFPDVYGHLAQALSGRTVVVYNVAFDRRILEISCRAHQLHMPLVAHWECAMEAYATFHGAWSRRHRSYTWQPLPGGAHQAIDDARATLALMEQMAQTPVEEDLVPTSMPVLANEGGEDFPF